MAMLTNEGEEEYLAHEAVTGQQLVAADWRCGGSLATYHAWQERRRRSGSPTALEQLALAARVRCFGGEDAYCARYAPMPADLAVSDAGASAPRGTQRWLRAARQQGRIPLTASDDAWLEGLTRALHADETIGTLLRTGRFGVTVRLGADGAGQLPMQARFAWLDVNREQGRIMALDLALVDRWGGYEDYVRRSRTVRLMAWERDLLALETGIGVGAITVLRIAVEREVPHVAQAFDADPEDLAQGSRLNAQVVEQLVACRSSGVWPTGLGGVRRLRGGILDAADDLEPPRTL